MSKGEKERNVINVNIEVGFLREVQLPFGTNKYRMTQIQTYTPP